jgi:isopentenyldiphosphate isomerase
MALEEQAIIVDVDDNVIGYKDRYSINKEDIVRIVVVWLEDGKGNVLVHKRSMNKEAGPGRWENAAGGGVAHKQTYEEAAYAELEEEIGVDDVDLEFVAKNIVHTDKGDRMCSWFKGTCNREIGEFVLETENVVEVKWIEKQELFNLRDKDIEAYMPSSAYWRELFSE